MRRELPVAFAAIAAGSLHSRMNQLELAASRALRRYETLHLLTVILATVVLVGSTELAVSDGTLAIVLTRALLVWFGLALLSGRFFGRWLSWILPVATIFPITYFGQDEQGRVQWWDWTGQPPSSVGCAAIAVVSMAVGIGAFYLTPWHLHALRRMRLRGEKPPVGPRPHVDEPADDVARVRIEESG